MGLLISIHVSIYVCIFSWSACKKYFCYTYITYVWLFYSMCPRMFLHTSRLRDRFLTDVTLTWFLTTMYWYVFLQVISPWKIFLHHTFVCFFTSMCHQMFLQTSSVRDGFLRDVILIWLLTTMCFFRWSGWEKFPRWLNHFGRYNWLPWLPKW